MPSASDAAAAPQPAPSGARIRWLLKAAFAVVAAWWMTLAVLALTTSNPVVVSPDQIGISDVVITGTVPPEGELVAVERVWYGEFDGTEVRVVNLAESAPVEPGQKYLFPISRSGNHYRITTLERQTSPPLVYPATPEALDQLRQILKKIGKP